MLRHGVRLEKAGTIQQPDAISSACLVQTLVRGRHVSSFTLAHEGHERISVLYEGTVFSGSVAVCFKRVDDCPAAHDWITAFVRKSDTAAPLRSTSSSTTRAAPGRSSAIPALQAASTSSHPKGWPVPCSSRKVPAT
jgi:hypothetical protein